MPTYDVFIPGDTRQFTWQSSVAPDSAPTFLVSYVNCPGIGSAGLLANVVASLTAIQSDTTHYYALFTMPTSEGYYLGHWHALKTVSGSVRNFIAPIDWLVRREQLPV